MSYFSKKCVFTKRTQTRIEATLHLAQKTSHIIPSSPHRLSSSTTNLLISLLHDKSPIIFWTPNKHSWNNTLDQGLSPYNYFKYSPHPLVSIYKLPLVCPSFPSIIYHLIIPDCNTQLFLLTLIYILLTFIEMPRRRMTSCNPNTTPNSHEAAPKGSYQLKKDNHLILINWLRIE